jgi:hypothetical protein
MSSASFAQSLKRVLTIHPEWREPLRRVLQALLDVPRGGVIDPVLVARLARVGKPEALGYLDVLRRAGLGELVVRVLDDDGHEVRRFESVRAIPARVQTDFGEEIVVTPENIDVAFEPNLPADIHEAAELVG